MRAQFKYYFEIWFHVKTLKTDNYCSKYDFFLYNITDRTCYLPSLPRSIHILFSNLISRKNTKTDNYCSKYDFFLYYRPDLLFALFAKINWINEIWLSILTKNILKVNQLLVVLDVYWSLRIPMEHWGNILSNIIITKIFVKLAEK